jgi:hypothetical protein
MAAWFRLMVRKRARKSRKPMMPVANVSQAEPKPCVRYAKTMLLTANFIAHLNACGACKAVLTYLNRQSEKELRYKNISRADNAVP